MSGHFRAFSFVDRIAPARDTSRIEGSYVIPAGLETFPSSLAAEAVGQLAAWGAMKAVDFERRPIAGLAGRIDLLDAAEPGQVLQLAAEIESVDAEAVAYRGCAKVDGTEIIRLEECVGPMIPVVDLDDPEELRERFALLCGPGVGPGGFDGLPHFVLHPVARESGSWARAAFQVPTSAPIFADHFPRRPIFPGSLLVQVCLELAGALAGEIPRPAASKWRLQSVLDVKLREFILPGKSLELEARLKQRTDASAMLTIRIRAGEDASGGASKDVVGSARLLLGLETCQRAQESCP